MAFFSIFTIFAALRLLLLVASAPAPAPAADATAAGGYWVGSIARQGTIAYGTAGYQVFRNVKDFGAKGDGATDDTVAINAAITAGSRCGQGCDSTTVTPALVYFPAGTYMVSAPLIQYYYTQFVGDATSLPTLKATAGFQGMAVIDADPYADGGINWYTNQVSILCTRYEESANDVNRTTSFDKSATLSLISRLCPSLRVLVFIGKSHKPPVSITSSST